MNQLNFGHVARRGGVCVIFAAALVALGGGASALIVGPETPWDLRDFYTFTMGNAALRYAVDNGEWRLEDSGGVQIVRHVTHSVTLADGTVIGLADYERGRANRETFESEFGGGNRFSTALVSKKGLTARHSIATPQDRPFFLVGMTVENTGAEPIYIKRISPIVVGAEAKATLPAGMVYRPRRLDLRGYCPVFDPGKPCMAGVFYDAAKERVLAFGVAPRGRADSGLDFKAEDGSFSGEIRSEFDPPVRLNPGESLEADPVWLCFSMPSPAEVEAIFLWAHSLLPKPESVREGPALWVTVPEGGTATDLLEAVRAWSGAGVRSALVPGSWEGRPGSFAGAAPYYPRQMRELAGVCRDMGVACGLTVDPTVAQGGAEAWAATSEDGQRWLNLSIPEAKAHAVNEMRQVAGWGFAFFVVAPSTMPDAILAQFGMTREQLDKLAFEVTAAAVGGAPVYASSAASLGLDEGLWREAAEAGNVLQKHGFPIGPVRFDAAAAVEVSAGVLDAMGAYAGPIELTGRPSAKLKRQMIDIARKRYAAAGRPMPPAPAPLPGADGEEEAVKKEAVAAGELAATAEAGEAPREKNGGRLENWGRRLKFWER